MIAFVGNPSKYSKKLGKTFAEGSSFTTSDLLGIRKIGSGPPLPMKNLPGLM